MVLSAPCEQRTLVACSVLTSVTEARVVGGASRKTGTWCLQQSAASVPTLPTPLTKEFSR